VLAPAFLLLCLVPLPRGPPAADDTTHDDADGHHDGYADADDDIGADVVMDDGVDDGDGLLAAVSPVGMRVWAPVAVLVG